MIHVTDRDTKLPHLHSAAAWSLLQVVKDLLRKDNLTTEDSEWARDRLNEASERIQAALTAMSDREKTSGKPKEHGKKKKRDSERPYTDIADIMPEDSSTHGGGSAEA